MTVVSRRAWLRALGTIGAGATVGCAPRAPDDGPWPEVDPPWDDELHPIDVGEAARLDIEALMEVLLPPDVDAHGVIVIPGAREVRAFDVMRARRFVPLAQARGLLPRTLGAEIEDVDAVDQAIAAALAADLSLRATERAPGAAFRDLPRDAQESIADDAFADPRTRDLYAVPRAACVLAFLGAIYTDDGLVAVGYPPFADRGELLASSGYPRTREDGSVDQYSYDRAPARTVEDDLALVLDANGDLR